MTENSFAWSLVVDGVGASKFASSLTEALKAGRRALLVFFFLVLIGDLSIMIGIDLSSKFLLSEEDEEDDESRISMPVGVFFDFMFSLFCIGVGAF